jgi:hypothetical protein
MKLDRPKYKNFKPGKFPTRADGFDSCELKYDGWWGQLLLEGHLWELYSRTGRRLEVGGLQRSYTRTLLHGEYIVGTEWAKDHPEYYGLFALFGVEIFDGKKPPYPDCTRRWASHYAAREIADENILGGVFAVNPYPIDKAPLLWRLNPEFEGLVFKDSQAPWGAPFGRMKREATMDYVCTGFLEANADRHKGWGVASIVGGLYVDGSLVTDVCATSSLTDTQRADFYSDPGRYIGQVFEVKGKKITKTGSMRHPDFVRWRPDKRPEECVWSTKR